MPLFILTQIVCLLILIGLMSYIYCKVLFTKSLNLRSYYSLSNLTQHSGSGMAASTRMG